MDVDSTTSIQTVKSTTPSGMTNMTPDDYRDIFWSMLRDAIDQMLTHPPGSYKPISYEQVSGDSIHYLKENIIPVFRCTQQCTSVCASSTVSSSMLTSSPMSSKQNKIRDEYFHIIVACPGPG